MPLPRPTERAAEQQRHEHRARSAPAEHEWEVRVDLPSLRETLDLASRLQDEGLEVHRRWRHLLVGAATENQAAELADRIRSEASAEAQAQVEHAPGGPHPVFVYIEAHKPGIARDLGL